MCLRSFSEARKRSLRIYFNIKPCKDESIFFLYIFIYLCINSAKNDTTIWKIKFFLNLCIFLKQKDEIVLIVYKVWVVCSFLIFFIAIPWLFSFTRVATTGIKPFNVNLCIKMYSLIFKYNSASIELMKSSFWPPAHLCSGLSDNHSPRWRSLPVVRGQTATLLYIDLLIFFSR